MAESTNRVHVSPGIYASETVDMKAATNSVGVTKLAVVGETLKGPAFQPYWISSQKEFANVFGGTSTKKFAGSNYPQYELPYIANEYLKKSNELCVVRTLGFSGYNAGPAWLITGQKSTNGKDGDKYVIAVLRSRGTYKYRAEYAKVSNNGCECQSAYDSLTYTVGEISNVASCSAPTSYNMDAVKLSPYYDLNQDGSLCSTFSLSGTALGFNAAVGNMGRFTIEVLTGSHNDGDKPGDKDLEDYTVKIPVSLNPSDRDYILKVLGTSNNDGDQPLFVESLYDVAWNQAVTSDGFDTIDSGLTTYNVAHIANYTGLDAVTGILTKHQGELKKRDIGKRYLCAKNLTDGTPDDIVAYIYDYASNTPEAATVKVSLTFDAATASTVSIATGEKFAITDGAYAGIYTNNCEEAKQVKKLCEGSAILNLDESIDIEKASGLDLYKSEACKEAYIYTVVQLTDANGNKHYVYKAYDEATLPSGSTTEYLSANDRVKCYYETTNASRNGLAVYNYEDALYYKNVGEPEKVGSEFTITGNKSFTVPAAGNLYIENTLGWKLQGVATNADGTWPVVPAKNYTFNDMPDNINYKAQILKAVDGKTQYASQIVPVETDLNNYKSSFRYSSTPWVVSNVKGDANHINVNKMFRFHTISDGAGSVTEVKVSIENIRPDAGTFDVVVRDYNDLDTSASVLERFTKCTMESGKKYIGYMIGTMDGSYVSKSKYITVEIAEGSAAANSVPAGFLGYSIPKYNGETLAKNANGGHAVMAPIAYNTEYDEDVAKKRQYFGLSTSTGYDYDYFSYKGKMATIEDPEFMTHGFHLDCRMSEKTYAGNDAPEISVDGVDGYVFDTVSVNARTSGYDQTPVISTETDMEGSIFEDVKLRKFTMCFAGGFDGWDIYRDQRTNTDEYAYTSYKGYVNKGDGNGYAFDVLKDGETYGIEGNALTSDYYSTLAGISLLKNPEEVDINLLATPGIDTINNTKLVQETFNILDDRADTFYVVTTPDTEMGSSEASDVEDIVDEFVNTELHSDYAATYYPWSQIEDDGKYIYLPATRDVVRNMAESDNSNTTQNLAPAGLTRGRVDAIRARKNLKVGESDALYEENINPVRTYAQEGIVIMGQKTLRESDDLLNRIDVRRCVLRMRKLIAIGTLGLIFDPNDSSTVKSFKSIVSSIMETFVKNRAISNWKMDVDDSEEAKDRLEISATIYIKPVRALEYISLNFVVTNNGAYFEE